MQRSLAALGATLLGACSLINPTAEFVEPSDGGGTDAATQLDDAALPDAGADAGDMTADAGTGTMDAGEAPCGHIGEACCPLPSPACETGANCTLEGCRSCGQPGETCCAESPACRTLTCLSDTGRCPAITPLVQVTNPNGGRYGIDAHEVTQAQYEDWLASVPVAAGALVGEGCGTNTSFLPTPSCTASGFGCSGAACRPRPQTCIDWCDAYAYCAAVGKQLCGRYDSTNPLPVSFLDDATQSPWYNACSSGGLNLFATGNDLTPVFDACQFADRVQARDAASLTECQSSVAGYEGVLALTGNVREWLNSCDSVSSPTANCFAVGGAFNDNDDFEAQCNFTFTRPRNNANASTGFRCCELSP